MIRFHAGELWYFCCFMKIPENPLISKKISKSSYLSQMTSDIKIKGKLFSSTFKVEENKVTLFFRSDVI